MEWIGETARMVIRPLSLDDVPGLMETLGDPAVMEHSVRGVCDEPAVERFVQWCQSCYKSHGVGPWALVEKGSSALIGFCGMAPEPVGDTEEINFGYRLARRFWGNGLATEAAHATLAYGFGTGKVASVVALIEPEHIASLRVAEKAGFRRFEAFDFHGKPVRLYRLNREEWRRQHEAGTRMD